MSIFEDNYALFFKISGKLISVEIKKDDGLPGLLILYLEYFDTVQSIKEGIYLDRNMQVPQSQQQLFLEEKLLDDSQTLSQCGIEDGSQIIVKGMSMEIPLCMHVLLEGCVYQIIQHTTAIDYYCKS